MQCAVTAWQLSDWVFEDLPEPLRLQWQRAERPNESPLVSFQNWARTRSNALRICYVMANAFKHRTLRKDREPSITSDTMIHFDEYLRLMPHLVLTLEGFVLAPVEVIREAHAFWSERMADAGLLERSADALHLERLESDPGGWRDHPTIRRSLER